jgi:DNA-directed RNA polymerase specialized sigma24 family protein
MATELPADEDPSRIRVRLLRQARAMGVPDMDADDVVDRALENAMLSDRPPTPGVSLGRRAGQALKDERIAYLRRGAARPQCVDEELPELPSSEDPTTTIEFIQSCEQIQERLGADTLQYIFLRICGLTEREIGELDGWDPLKAGRIRIDLRRKAPMIFASILQIPSRTTEKEAS